MGPHVSGNHLNPPRLPAIACAATNGAWHTPRPQAARAPPRWRVPPPMEPGIHLVHKPAGPTSAEVLREALAQDPGGRARACHGGTLDPFASGLLLVLTGGATRLFELLHAAPKRYFAEVRWGVETHSGDALGEPVARGDTSSLSPQALDGALATFLGWTEQIPPSTSAKKIGGEPAYKKVHRGE